MNFLNFQNQIEHFCWKLLILLLFSNFFSLNFFSSSVSVSSYCFNLLSDNKNEGVTTFSHINLGSIFLMYCSFLFPIVFLFVISYSSNKPGITTFISVLSSSFKIVSISSFNFFCHSISPWFNAIVESNFNFHVFIDSTIYNKISLWDIWEEKPFINLLSHSTLWACLLKTT